MKNKLKRIILINLLAIFVVFLVVEAGSYLFLCFRYKEDIINYKNIMYPILNIDTKKTHNMFMGYHKAKHPDIKRLIKLLRPVEKRNENKKPIILFGCSYTYGFGLNEDETFSRKLADYTDRTVINRGSPAMGIPFVYYQLSNKDIMKDLPKNSEYIIYTFIPDHIPRLFRYRNFVMTGDHTLRYKLKNNKLIPDEIRFLLLHSLFTSIIIEEYIAEKNSLNQQKRDKLFLTLIDEIYNKIKENFPCAKFVILNYECPFDKPDLYKYLLDIIKEKHKDIIIININKELPILKEDKYWIEDKSHPSASAWDLVVPLLSRKLNLKN